MIFVTSERAYATSY